MTGVFAVVAVVLAGLVLALLAFVVAVRVLGARRRARRAELQEEIGGLVARYLAVEDAPAPQLPRGPLERSVLREVASETLAELRGSERERLVDLLLASGIVDAATAGLRSRRRRVRREAAETLALAPAQRTAAALAGGLRDSDLRVRLTCARALAILGDEERAREAVEREAAAAPGAVTEVLLALGASRPDAIGEIAASAGAADVRATALAVIAALRLAEHAPLLREALDSTDDELAARAARGLGRIGEVSAAPALEQLLGGGERTWFVRAAAAGALGVLGSSDAVPLLERQLTDDAWALQHTAAVALAQLGPEGEAALQRALTSPHDSVRAHARAALDR